MHISISPRHSSIFQGEIGISPKRPVTWHVQISISDMLNSISPGRIDIFP